MKTQKLIGFTGGLGSYVISRSTRGILVETWSRCQGDITGRRVILNPERFSADLALIQQRAKRADTMPITTDEHWAISHLLEVAKDDSLCKRVLARGFRIQYHTPSHPTPAGDSSAAQR